MSDKDHGVWGVILCEWDNNKNNYYFLNPHILRKAVPSEGELHQQTWSKRGCSARLNLGGEKVRFWEIEKVAFILASSLVSLSQSVSVHLLCIMRKRRFVFEFVTGSSRGYVDSVIQVRPKPFSGIRALGCVFRCLYVVTMLFSLLEYHVW